MEPIAIATLAFLGTKVGETLVEKFTEAVLPKADALRKKIWEKLRGNPNAEIALQAAENGSQADLKRVAKYLDVAMEENPEFAGEVKQLAENIAKETEEETDTLIQYVFGDTASQNKVIVNSGKAYTGNITINEY